MTAGSWEVGLLLGIEPECASMCAHGGQYIHVPAQVFLQAGVWWCVGGTVFGWGHTPLTSRNKHLFMMLLTLQMLLAFILAMRYTVTPFPQLVNYGGHRYACPNHTPSRLMQKTLHHTSHVAGPCNIGSAVPVCR